MVEWSALALSIAALFSLAFYVKWSSPKAEKRRHKKRLKQIPAFDRGKVIFHEHYPRFSYGPGSYGLPAVREFGDGTTLVIGNYCSIAEEVLIVLGGHHRTDWVSTYPFPSHLSEAAHIADASQSRGDVLIGHDVWLCSRCTILSGVTVGNGAVVAAGAVVTRNVPPYAIVAGNPARVIGWRFDEAVRAEVLAAEWWLWPREEVAAVVGLLCSDNIGAFLNHARARAGAAVAA
ncbi:DapH/DapD/GlmU-related protein [Pseudomonas sp. NPDC007930]|uniref:CatB-related O-acetyltransferase n=1 Tax=Pseudomonas sp. NPDC007930 TaxID=3364417 RepID=UPI0036E3C3FA